MLSEISAYCSPRDTRLASLAASPPEQRQQPVGTGHESPGRDRDRAPARQKPLDLQQIQEGPDRQQEYRRPDARNRRTALSLGRDRRGLFRLLYPEGAREQEAPAPDQAGRQSRRLTPPRT
ncbi:hypothetical protein, partial [Rhodovulum sulfidophilum]|uniref:hypothetical protein n=1 Tax=Rhodovulum sulfidophilum TaxID=35806 RepID=UPI001A927E60